MTHDDMIAVIAAHRDGKSDSIEQRYIFDGHAQWVAYRRMTEPPFDFLNYEYRIKPEAPKPRNWWVSFDEDGNICSSLPYFPGIGIGAVHVREVLPSSGEEGK